MTDPYRTSLDSAILESIWGRILWDFLVQNPQLEEWLQGSTLQATDELQEGKPLYRLAVANPAIVAWLDYQIFAIERSLSVELKRPVVVRVVAMEVTE